MAAPATALPAMKEVSGRGGVSVLVSFGSVVNGSDGTVGVLVDLRVLLSVQY